MQIECQVLPSTLRVGDQIVAVGDARLPRPVWVRERPSTHAQRWEPRPDHMTRAGMATNCQVLRTTIRVPYTRHEPTALDLNLYAEDHEPVTVVMHEDDDLAAEAVIVADRLRAAHLSVKITRMGETFATASSAFSDAAVYVQPMAVYAMPRGVYVQTFYGDEADPLVHGARKFGAIKGKVTRVMRRYRSANAGAQEPRRVEQGIWGNAWCVPVPQPEPCHVSRCVYREGHDTDEFPHRAAGGSVLTPQVAGV